MRQQQRGFSLIVTLVVIMLVVSMTIAYVYRSSLGVRVSGSMRDANLAQLLAEAGIGRIVGLFSSQDTTLADINGNGTPDIDEAATIDLSTSPQTLPLGYVFYPKAGNSTPIIQRVASGEGAGNAVATMGNQRVDTAITSMRIDDLFVSGSVRPFLFVQSATGAMSASGVTWGAEPATQKVAVWFEAEVNPTNAAAVDVYCAAASQYGKARSYLREFVGTYQ